MTTNPTPSSALPSDFRLVNLSKSHILVIKALILHDNKDKLFSFIMIIEPAKLNIKKCSFFFTHFNEKIFDSIDVHSGWKVFYHHIRFLNSEVNNKFSEDSDMSVFKIDSTTYQNHLDKFMTTDDLIELCRIINDNADRKVQNILLHETVSDCFMRNVDLNFDEMDLEVELYDSEKKTSDAEDEQQDQTGAKARKSTDDSIIQVEVLPIVDPVNGIRAEKLKIDECITVKIKNKNLDIVAPVHRILPATMRDRLFITVKIADDTFGNMIIPNNLKLKTRNTKDTAAYDNYLFYLYLIGGLIMFLLIIALVLIIF